MVREIARNIRRRFYDTHPNLPLDPDSDQLKAVRPIHTDPAHILIVGIGAFFGTLARYGMGLWLPSGEKSLPVATLLINVTGAFLLGLLLQGLFRRGKDEGGRRVVRLALGTGFLGAFTTYSSLATGVVLLVRGDMIFTAVTYGIISVILGIAAGAFGIRLATVHHVRRGGDV